MIHIDELSLTLPFSFAHRAERISQLAQDKMSGINVSGGARLNEVVLPDMEMDESASDHDIADMIARHLEQAIGGSC